MPHSNETDRRPIDAESRSPIGPLPQPGYYPGFSTLDQQKFWDEKTRSVILARVNDVPPIRFFSAGQAATLKAICDRVLPQDDRDDDHKIPIVAVIDNRLYLDEHDGYRYERMLPDREAYPLAIAAIDSTARQLHGVAFVDLAPHDQERLLLSLHDAKPAVAHEAWEKMPVERFWTLLVQDCAEAYYSHPYAWDEIGFGGPAYPRAYMRLERGEPETWEVDEERYDWEAPSGSISDRYTPVGGSAKQHASPGQGGTH